MRPVTRSRIVGVVTAVGIVVVVSLGAVFATYQRQIWSYLTHTKGGPSETWPYEPRDPAPVLHLAAAGDIGDSGVPLDRTAAAMAAIAAGEPYDVLWLLGDNVYPSGDPSRLGATVFTPFADVLDAGTDLLAILGNHDVAGGRGDEQLAALGMESRWWQRRYGDVLLVGLDSNDTRNDEQRSWLERTLRDTDARWKIVGLHHPPYSSGYQGSTRAARDAFAPVFERYGVQLVLSGHDHDYQRSVPIGGVTYIVTGAGSDTRGTGESDFTAAAWSTHHFTDIAVFPDRIELRAVDQEQRVFDEVTLR
jgi:3',5'-cyclic AMP phosphodiesterase CpdA